MTLNTVEDKVTETTGEAFYQFSSVNSRLKKSTNNNLYTAEITLNPSGNTVVHAQNYRREWSIGSGVGFLDVAAYFGGLIYISYLVLGYLLRPIAEYSFSIKAARQLFVARTTYPTLFLPSR